MCSDFQPIRNFLHEYMQYNCLQSSSRQQLQEIVSSSRFQQLPQLIEGETFVEDALIALFLLRYAAEWLEQLQEQSSTIILEQHQHILTALQEVPLLADPLEGKFYAFVSHMARNAGDEALFLAYSERYQHYQECYTLDSLLLGLSELYDPRAWDDWITFYHLLDGGDKLASVANHTHFSKDEQDTSTDFLFDFSQVMPSCSLASDDYNPIIDFIPPLYNAQNYQYPISSPRQKHKVKVNILNLAHGQEHNFQASLARSLTLTHHNKTLELHLNLTPEYNAMYLLRQIDKALWQLTLVFDNDEMKKKQHITINTCDIYQHETSRHRLRVAFRLPMKWQNFLECIDMEALWQQLDSIVLLVTMASPWNNSKVMKHSAPWIQS